MQQIIGQLLWYARCVDPTLSKLGSQQANPTIQVERAAERLLLYVASWPNAVTTFRASNMNLILYADASYLSESKSRSRAGGMHFLGDTLHPKIQKSNGCINILSSIIPVVCSSTTEAEYAAVFPNACLAESTRRTLNELGYPQEATPIFTDNSCAVALANGTGRHARATSNAIDMRFNWIQDRIQQGHFVVSWTPGHDNYADFLTKALPTKEHLRQRSSFVSYVTPPPTPASC